MFRLKRTKPPPPADPHGTVAVHYAARVEPSGNVDAWTADPAAACEISHATAALVLEAYSKRPAAGRLGLEEVRPPKAEAVPEAQPEVKTEAQPEPALKVSGFDESRHVVSVRGLSWDKQPDEDAAARPATAPKPEKPARKGRSPQSEE